MPTNFEYLKDKKEYMLFSDACIETEKVLSTSLMLSILGCYEALTFAVKWVYAVENISTREKYKSLDQFIYDPLFKSIVDEQIYLKLPYVVKLWKFTLNSEDEITKDDAVLVLSILFEFVLWVSYIYGLTYDEKEFKEEDIPVGMIMILNKEMAYEKKSLIFRDEKESRKLEDQILNLRNYFISKKEANRKNRKFTPVDFYKMRVREFYIDLDLKFSGWDPERDVKKNVEYTIRNGIEGKEKIALDYLLVGKDGLPLAIIEGKYSLEDIEYGRKLAIKYASHIGGETRRIPAIFLVNGGSFYYMENINSVPREIGGIFDIEDLHRIKNQIKSKKNLITVPIDTRIANMKYQVDAIKAITSDFIENKTKSLIFMANGSVPSRVLCGLIDLMSRANYVTSILYLIGRDVQLKYTKKLLKQLILSMSIGEYTKYSDETGRLIISTPEDIIKELGNITGSGEKYFSPGKFDLIVVENLCRNTIAAYGKIFEYFDSSVVGISSLPKADLDLDVFDFFETTREDNRYIYYAEEALEKDKIIVPYSVVNIENKMLENGMLYDHLAAENKNLCEETYTDDPSKMLNWVPNPMVDDYLMNTFTIDTVLMNIMKVGIKEAKSETVGKTIIFAQNKKHGELILQRFRIKFPDFGNEFVKLALFNERDSVDDFINPNKNMNILIDVGFATMGMNIPEILNIVLFKKVYSKFEFQQMISIGNRICNNITCIEPKEGIYIGKKRYYIFDYLENFTFFNEDKKSIKGIEVKNISEEIFIKHVRLIYSIQNDKITDKDYQAFSGKLIDSIVANIENVSKELTNVHLQLRSIDRYCIKSTYTDGITKEDKTVLETQIAPLVRMKGEEYSLQFDNFMYGLMLAQVEATPFFIRAKEQLGNICNMLLKNENEPEVKNEIDHIRYYGSSKFLDNSTIMELDQVRIRLRKIIQYLFSSGSNKEEDEKKKKIENSKEKNDKIENVSGENVDFSDSREDDESENDNKIIKEYKEKIIDYIMTSFHQVAVYKLRNNMPIMPLDYQSLDKMFVKRLGTKNNYKDAFGDIPYGLLVRKIAKLEKESVKVAFFDVTEDKTLNDEQKQFLKGLMNDVIENGYLDEYDLTGNENEKFYQFREIFDEGRQKKIIRILNTIKANAMYK
ncbi:MAG: hypothetical protein LBT51_10435 [Fusobacteriaceae bacterium]|jgi:type I restriction enzyme R subunit|nr:hypothetical protein [Fusobacteriaceae bacterium]